MPSLPSVPPASAVLQLPVRRALAAPSPPERATVEAGGLEWAVATWGGASDPPVLLVHGVTSSAATWWRVGPAIAAAGLRVVAVDQPGHGRTTRWLGHHRFADNAADLAAFVRAAGLARPDLRVVGHSWGAMTSAALPAAGILPAVLVLLDPPALPREAIATMLDDPVERHYDDYAEGYAAVRAANPTWSDGDVAAKVEALTQFDESAVRDVLLGNDWDGGLAALEAAAARDVEVWIIRGEPEHGSLLHAEALPALEARLGAGRIVALPGAPHSPQRTHPEATVAALLGVLRA